MINYFSARYFKARFFKWMVGANTPTYGRILFSVSKSNLIISVTYSQNPLTVSSLNLPKVVS